MQTEVAADCRQKGYLHPVATHETQRLPFLNLVFNQALQRANDLNYTFRMQSFRNLLLFDCRGEQLKNKTVAETSRYHSENILSHQ